MRKYLLIALMIGVVSVFGFGGCSLLNTTSVQCLSEAECLAKGPAFANTTCDSVSKTCMQVDAGARSCQHNSDCIAANNNAAAICRKSDYKCAVLQTAECPDFLGTLDQLKNDNAIVLGMLSGFPTDLISLQYERAVTMAQQDFTTSSGVMGLPSFDGSGNVRPVVFVSCNEFQPATIPAANHLAKDLQVPIVLGPLSSADTLTVWQQVFLPAGIMMISTGIVYEALVQLGPNPAAPTPLFWRLGSTDALVGQLVAGFVKDALEPQLATIGAKQPGDQTRVLLLQEDSFPGASETGVLEKILFFNGQLATQQTSATFQFAHMGNPILDPVNDPAPLTLALQTVVPVALQMQPHIIIAESNTPWGAPYVVAPIESAWAQGTAVDGGPPAPRPQFVTYAGGWQTQLPSLLKTDPTILNRIFLPGTLKLMTDANLIANYVTRFNNANMDVPPITATAGAPIAGFDAAYMAEYVIASIGNAPVTGVNAARAAVKFTTGGGQQINADPTLISVALDTLSSGGTFTMEGITGPFIFDPTRAVRLHTISNYVACLGPGANGGPPVAVPTGYALDPNTLQGTGTWDMTKCPAAP
jgi:hypothetical protein